MSRRFAAEHAAVLLEHLQHVPVADIGAQEFDAEIRDRAFDAVVRHQRADDRTAQRAVRVAVAGQHKEQVVAVGNRAVVIDHLQAVAVAVEGDAEIGDLFAHSRCRAADRSRRSRD